MILRLEAPKNFAKTQDKAEKVMIDNGEIKN
jgi:hypothetical protein